MWTGFRRGRRLVRFGRGELLNCRRKLQTLHYGAYSKLRAKFTKFSRWHSRKNARAIGRGQQFERAGQGISDSERSRNILCRKVVSFRPTWNGEYRQESGRLTREWCSLKAVNHVALRPRDSFELVCHFSFSRSNSSTQATTCGSKFNRFAASIARSAECGN